jgi:hypothetical protein
MAVSKSGLESALKELFTPSSEGGSLPNSDDGITAHQEACAALWADAMQTYVAGMDPIHVAAPTGAASSSLQTALEGVFAAWFALDTYPETGCADMNAAFTAFAQEIFDSAATSLSAPGRVFAGKTMPTPDIDFCSLGTADTYAAAATNFANLIDTWFTSGYSETTDDSPPEKPHIELPWS